MNQCYVPADSSIKLGRNLPQRLFYTQGDFGPDTVPFVWVAMNTGGYASTRETGSETAATPGYYFVTYTYELSNPLG